MKKLIIILLLLFSNFVFGQKVEIRNGKILEDNYIVKTVKANGTGDYSTIASALAGITDATVNKQYKILIYSGTYNEVHLQTKDYVHLYGKDKNTCIINGAYPDETPIATMVANSTIEWSGKICDIKNLTIEITNGRYTIHDDADYNGTKTLENCILKHNGNMGAEVYWDSLFWNEYQYAFGHGFRGNENVYIINTVMSGRNGGLFSHTQVTAYSPSLMYISGCTFTADSSNYSIKISYYYSNGDVYRISNSIINKTFYIQNVVSCLGYIILDNTTYDVLYCRYGGCFP